MSPSDKTPKPSRKRTLEDVQQHLQDLVDNELASPVKLNAIKPETPKQTPAPKPAAKATVRKKPRKSKDLIHALESLANRAAAAPEEPPSGAAQSSDIQQETPQAMSPPPSHAQTVSPDNLDLFQDSETAPEDEATPFDNTQATSVQDRIAAVVTRTRDEAPIEGTVSNATQWEDDIPVLKEVAALPPVGGDTDIIHDLEPLPKPTRSRDLAVRVIAKLNIEMRKEGGPGLVPQTIKRLQTLLQEELEQQAANMDNTDNE